MEKTNGNEEKFDPKAAIGVAVLIGAIAIVILLFVKFADRPIQSTSDSANTTQSNNVFYTQETTNVHDCPKITCKVDGQVDANTAITLPYASVDDMPDYVSSNFENEKGETYVGYISKTLLGQNQVTVKTVQPQSAQQQVSNANAQATQNNTMQAYNDCLATAKADYLGSWATACANAWVSYSQCYQEYGDLKDYCRQTYGGWQNSPTCTLTGGSAVALNASYESDKNRCASVYGNTH